MKTICMNCRSTDVLIIKDINAHVVCKDGATISVQGNRNAYCEPRDDFGPYTQVECGYPSVAPQDTMLEYMDGGGEPTQTVYGYVPIAIVWEFINLHGGIASGELPAMRYV